MQNHSKEIIIKFKSELRLAFRVNGQSPKTFNSARHVDVKTFVPREVTLFKFYCEASKNQI